MPRHAQAPAGDVLVALPDSLDHIVDRQPEPGESSLVGEHVDLTHEPAANLGRRHPFDAEETFGEDVVGPGA